MPVYLQIIFSAAGIGVMLCAVIVSTVQLCLARKKLQMELLPTRMRVFEAIIGLYCAVIKESRVTADAFGAFYKTVYVEGGRFYFPPKIVQWIGGVQNKAHRFCFIADSLTDGEKLDLVDYFGQLPQETESMLTPYLQIG